LSIEWGDDIDLMMIMGGSEGALGEEVRGELHSGLHVSLDLHLALHEGSLGVELSREEVNGIAIDQREGGIGLALLGVLDRSIAVLEINSPEDGILTLGRRNLEVVDEPDLLDRLSAMVLEVGSHLVESRSNLQSHQSTIYLYEVIPQIIMS
jgi:hypothetical protein